MATIDVHEISKSFGAQKAVDRATFEVNPAEIFGLLGPNGAGKTTCLRIILDIFKPDSGKVAVFGGPMDEAKKNRIGYLPEERGLYQDIPLERCLVYLATLKGLSQIDAAARIHKMLIDFDLALHAKKKVKELSKGMQQKAQLIITLVHDPELIIIDEPFSALDPVNTQMVKDLLREERSKGKTVIMCTHQMNQVEELCDRIVLINEGQVVLNGNLNQIRRNYSGHDVLVSAVSPLPEKILGVEKQERVNHLTRLHLSQNITPQQLLQNLVEQGVLLEKFEIAIPTLDQIFIEIVTGEGSSG